MGRRRRKSNFKHQVVIGLVVLLAIGVAVFAAMSDVTRDPLTGCSKDARLTENTYALLIDTTDALPAIQRQKINNLIEQLLSSTETENRFQIYEVDATESKQIAPLFDRCSYQTNFAGSPASDRYRARAFDQDLDTALQSSAPANQSPIIYSINGVAASLPIDNSQKHLIVISDLYEHSSLFSLYRTSLSEALEQNEQKILSQMPDLRGVQVYLKMIDRPELNQDAEFIESWLDFFRRAGATLRTHRAGSDGNTVVLEIAERITG